MKQSRKGSVLESLTNVGIGYSVAIVSQLLIFPLFGIRVTFLDNLGIGAYFTAISLIRSYTIRRFFTNKGVK